MIVCGETEEQVSFQAIEFRFAEPFPGLFRYLERLRQRLFRIGRLPGPVVRFG